MQLDYKFHNASIKIYRKLTINQSCIPRIWLIVAIFINKMKYFIIVLETPVGKTY